MEFNNNLLYKKTINESIKNKKKDNTNYNLLLKILIPVTALFAFIVLLFTKIDFSKNKEIKENKENNENKINGITCDKGLFLPEDDKEKCIKCSTLNCDECKGNKINNICT